MREEDWWLECERDEGYEEWLARASEDHEKKLREQQEEEHGQ